MHIHMRVAISACMNERDAIEAFAKNILLFQVSRRYVLLRVSITVCEHTATCAYEKMGV